MRVDKARAEAKPPMPSGDTVLSAPPATITSTSPYSIIRPASPMQCRPVVQAVTMARLGPVNPKRIDTWPAIMLMIDAGTKKGEMRRAPRSLYSLCVASIIGKPPMPEPTITPMRSASSSDKSLPVGKPASRTAWIDAAIP